MYLISCARKRSARKKCFESVEQKFHEKLEEWGIDSLIDTVSGQREFVFSTEKEGYGRKISANTVQKYAKAGYKIGVWEKPNGDLVLHTISWEENK